MDAGPPGGIEEMGRSKMLPHIRVDESQFSYLSPLLFLKIKSRLLLMAPASHLRSSRHVCRCDRSAFHWGGYP